MHSLVWSSKMPIYCLSSNHPHLFNKKESRNPLRKSLQIHYKIEIIPKIRGNPQFGGALKRHIIEVVEI